MAKYTVILLVDGNVSTNKIEADDPVAAGNAVALDHYNDGYIGWTETEKKNCALPFDREDYVVVAVYEGHQENLYSEL